MLGYLSLLALCASASVFAAPVNEARAADIVGTVHCQLTAEAPLVLRIPSGALLSLDLDGADQALAGLDKPEARAFNFWQCDSPFMGYKFTAGSGGSKAYGHIRPVGEDDNCLTSTSPGDNRTHFAAKKCSFSDDSSQEALFWSIQRTKGQADAPVYFIDAPANADPAASTYFYNLESKSRADGARPLVAGKATPNGSHMVFRNVTSIGSLGDPSSAPCHPCAA